MEEMLNKYLRHSRAYLLRIFSDLVYLIYAIWIVWKATSHEYIA